MGLQHMQIGEVAERTNLSLRTIRYYEEVDLVPPSARTPGGFRLYTEADVAHGPLFDGRQRRRQRAGAQQDGEIVRALRR